MKSQPSSPKWRNSHLPISRKFAKGNSKIAWGEHALQSKGCKLIDFKEIEAARKVISRRVKKLGQLRIKIFTNVPRTSKGTARQGGGKGAIDRWSAFVSINTIIFEIKGVPSDIALLALEKCRHKLSVPCKVISVTDNKETN